MMPAISSNVRISIEANGRSFRLNASRALHGRYRLKVGRSWSTKHANTTLTEIFELGRKWAVRQERPYWRGWR